VPQDIDSSDALLAEISAEADRLGLSYSGNPNNLSQPVDAIDAMIELLCPDEGVRALQKQLPPQWMDHEYTDIDDQPDDPEEIEMAQDTLNFFVNDLRYDPKDKDFEKEFRAFLSDDDYSYSAKTIKHLISSVLGLD
jgi:hypothetical protein